MRQVFPVIGTLMLAAASIFAATPEARRAFLMFEQRAEQGDAEAQYRLGVILETGWDSVPADSARALALFRRSAEGAFPPAMNYLGYLYGEGYGKGNRVLLRQNPDSALYWLKASADRNDSRAMSNLAYLLLHPDKNSKNPDEIEKDRGEAIDYLKRAALQGAPTAMSMLGDLYRDGNGVPVDTLQAVELYESALNAGLGDAEPRLITMMARDWRRMSQQRQFDTGMKYFTTYAPGAGVVLLEMASELRPVPELHVDSLRAVTDSVLRAGAVESLALTARAQTLLGEAASRERGMKYDHDKSMEYFVRGALAGNPSAMFILSETLEMFPDVVSEVLPRIDRTFLEGLAEYAAKTCVSLPSAAEVNDSQAMRARAGKAGISDAREADAALYRMAQ